MMLSTTSQASANEDSNMDPDHLKKFAEMVHCLEIAVGRALSHKANDAYYNNISLGYSRFMVGLNAALDLIEQRRGKLKKLKFLDVGCGLGTKMLLAKNHGLIPYGIDTNPKYLEVVREMEMECEMADALTFEKYADFDLIYWYIPIRDRPLMEQLEDRICAEANENAVLFPGSRMLFGARHGWTEVNPVTDDTFRLLVR